jgi:hypothetical protein
MQKSSESWKFTSPNSPHTHHGDKAAQFESTVSTALIVVALEAAWDARLCKRSHFAPCEIGPEGMFSASFICRWHYAIPV